MISTINRKLIRDSWQIKGQILAIAMVLAAGVATFVMAQTTFFSLQSSRDQYYQNNRFAHIFASLKRAPMSVAEKIDEIPGVAAVDTRVVTEVPLNRPNQDDLANVRIISIRLPRVDGLNIPHLRKGRFPVSGNAQEVIASEAFMDANQYQLGQTVSVVLNGRHQELTIVGTALSPEFVYTLRPGDSFPDDLRYGVFWMDYKVLAASMNMEGAFNDLTLLLAAGVSETSILETVNENLKTYGGLDAIGRKDQISHWFLENELTQLKSMSMMIPLLFFLVAVFLLNLVVARLIQGQREQIAVLKAFGYSHAAVGIHFLQLVLLVVTLGCGLGIVLGLWMGSGLTELYTKFYRFPLLAYEVNPTTLLGSFFFAGIIAIIGTLATVRRAVNLPPAEAMRPIPPASFKPTLIERIGLGRWLTTQTRMVLRNLERHPVRSGLSTLGLGLAVGVLIVGRFNVDTIEELLEVQFNQTQRYDLSVTFIEPIDSRVFYELQNMRGVRAVEAYRQVPIRIRNGHLNRKTGLLGVPTHPSLYRPLDQDRQPIVIPEKGILIGRMMAEILEVSPGDRVDIEVLERARKQFTVHVSGIVDEFIGSNVYMNQTEVNRMMNEGRVMSGVYLMVDKPQQNILFNKLRQAPEIAGVSAKAASVDGFKKTIAESILIINFFNILFSALIAFGVIYNSAQMILSERSRDLGTLRVMGFTRAEISSVLLGELAFQTLVAIPLGFLLGSGLAWITSRGMQTELFRLPYTISHQTYGLAALTVILSALFSGLIVRRKLDRLDLLAVLKTRE